MKSYRSVTFNRRRTMLWVLASVLWVPVLRAQDAAEVLPDAPQAPDAQRVTTVRNLPSNLLHDQAAIWTSPLRLRDSNAIGPVLLVLATAGTMTIDHQVMSSHFQDANTNKHAVTASNGLVGAFVATPVALYGMGILGHDERARETGMLGGEAILDSLAVNEGLKLITLRERPTVDGARGKFFQTSGAPDSSFPSNHSIVAWSSAAVIASEYDGPMTKLVAYGLATGVSMTRVIGREHFPSDVLVGSAVGYLIGRYVYHRHHAIH